MSKDSDETETNRLLSKDIDHEGYDPLAVKPRRTLQTIIPKKHRTTTQTHRRTECEYTLDHTADYAIP